MPPGTGDIHLSILENYFISGAIIVTTPQKIAVKDVTKLLNLYKKFDVHIYGLINNMSNLPGEAFKDLAIEHNLKILAQIELIPNIAKACDAGEQYYQLLPKLFHAL
jgi:ATP-binding protein involved in chromosome partitioning